MNIDDVKALAREMHHDQVDKAGRPYFDAHLYPIADAARVFGAAAEVASWMHDIIEDTAMTAEGLTEFGLDAQVVDAVVAVTRRAGESYDDLITRACAHPLGRFVKLTDNAWNVTSNPSLAQAQPAIAEQMLRRRYLPARTRLLTACALSESSPEILAMQAVLGRHHARLG